MDAKKERYKRIRGAILKIMAHSHPGCIDLKVLHYLLDDLRYTITEDECRSHIAYLEDKGFAAREARKSSGVEIELIGITPKGLDLLDGFIADVGVDARF